LVWVRGIGPRPAHHTKGTSTLPTDISHYTTNTFWPGKSGKFAMNRYVQICQFGGRPLRQTPHNYQSVMRGLGPQPIMGPIVRGTRPTQTAPHPDIRLAGRPGSSEPRFARRAAPCEQYGIPCALQSSLGSAASFGGQGDGATMDSHDPGHGDHPAAILQFRVETTPAPARPRRWWSWTRCHDIAPRGIQIVDERTGAPVAVVYATAENAATIAHLFVTSPTMWYGIGRARKLLRNMVQGQCVSGPHDDETTAVRQLLREIHDAVDRRITTNTTHTRKGE
jgi:hypothetical protein